MGREFFKILEIIKFSQKRILRYPSKHFLEYEGYCSFSLREIWNNGALPHRRKCSNEILPGVDLPILFLVE